VPADTYDLAARVQLGQTILPVRFHLRSSLPRQRGAKKKKARPLRGCRDGYQAAAPGIARSGTRAADALCLPIFDGTSLILCRPGRTFDKRSDASPRLRLTPILSQPKRLASTARQGLLLVGKSTGHTRRRPGPSLRVLLLCVMLGPPGLIIWLVFRPPVLPPRPSLTQRGRPIIKTSRRQPP
jgi:hypothetical protein